MKKIEYENLGKECAKAFRKYNKVDGFLSEETEDWREELFDGEFVYCEELSNENERLCVNKKNIDKLNLTIFEFIYEDENQNIIEEEYYLE